MSRRINPARAYAKPMAVKSLDDFRNSAKTVNIRIAAMTREESIRVASASHLEDSSLFSKVQIPILTNTTTQVKA
jgi:hypothetical protein